VVVVSAAAQSEARDARTFAMPDALAPLMAVPNWVIWKWATSKKGKPTKVPYMATRPSAMASTTNFTTWASYDKAHSIGLGEGRWVGLLLARYLLRCV
jgi:primase-polymerase (primpol)-like protein